MTVFKLTEWDWIVTLCCFHRRDYSAATSKYIGPLACALPEAMAEITEKVFLIRNSKTFRPFITVVPDGN